MKNKRSLFITMLIVGCFLGAGDSFHLIRTHPQKRDSSPFTMGRDLFVYGTAAVPVQTPDETAAPVDVSDPSAASSDPLSEPNDFMSGPDIVLLGAIVRQNKRCALIAINGEMKVFEEGESLENGWLVEQVTLSTVLIRTEKETMMLAVEGDGHE